MLPDNLHSMTLYSLINNIGYTSPIDIPYPLTRGNIKVLVIYCLPYYWSGRPGNTRTQVRSNLDKKTHRFARRTVALLT